jgi:hypothetical protein
MQPLNLENKMRTLTQALFVLVSLISVTPVHASEILGTCSSEKTEITVELDANGRTMIRGTNLPEAESNLFDNLWVSRSKKDSRLIFSRYGMSPSLSIQFPSLRGALSESKDGPIKKLNCKVDALALKDRLGIDVNKSSPMKCIPYSATGSWPVSDLMKGGVIGTSMDTADLAGMPKCFMLDLRVGSIADLAQARATIGNLYRGAPIQYEISGAAVAQ